MAKMASQIRLNEILSEKIKAIATIEMRTMNAQMEYFLNRAVADYEEANGVIPLSEFHFEEK